MNRLRHAGRTSDDDFRYLASFALQADLYGDLSGVTTLFSKTVDRNAEVVDATIFSKALIWLAKFPSVKSSNSFRLRKSIQSLTIRTDIIPSRIRLSNNLFRLPIILKLLIVFEVHRNPISDMHQTKS